MKLIDCSTKTYPNTFAMVDDEDFEHLNQWRWYASNGYAMRKTYTSGCKYRATFFIHREILKPKSNIHVDHINGNRMDNRRNNLRLCNIAQNNRNVGKQHGTSSIFKGVAWINREKRFRSQIRCDKKSFSLGSYVSEINAAIAYNIAAIKYHQDFAKLNPIPFTT